VFPDKVIIQKTVYDNHDGDKHCEHQGILHRSAPFRSIVTIYSLSCGDIMSYTVIFIAAQNRKKLPAQDKDFPEDDDNK